MNSIKKFNQNEIDKILEIKSERKEYKIKAKKKKREK